MDASIIYEMPFVDSVVFATDFSEASEKAFAHALAIALIRQTRFVILHAGDNKGEWTRYPAVRRTLEKWGFLEAGSDQSEVLERLNMRVGKVMLKGKPLKAIVKYLKECPADLIVLSTHKRGMLSHWLRPSVAESIHSESKTMTLFVPDKGRGIVSMDSGQIQLRRILVPVDESPNPLAALEYAARVANITRHAVEIVLLHVGDLVESFEGNLPEGPSVTWRKVIRHGDVVSEIIQAANDWHVDMIMMTTAGHTGILGALRGSITREVLHQSPCPLLAIPSH
jgi:nucleotide-binding universal stress UspA family protein